MRTIDIVPDQWSRFCEDFSRQHRGWRASTMVFEPSVIAGQPTAAPREHGTARDLPFSGLSLEPNGRDLVVLLGEGKVHISEPIFDVQRISLLETDEGAHVGVRIEKSDASGVALRFRTAARPDALDGVAECEI